MTELEKSKENYNSLLQNAEKNNSSWNCNTDEEIVNSYSCKVIGKDGSKKLYFGNWGENWKNYIWK